MRRAWLLVLLAVASCRRVPAPGLEAPLEVKNVTVAFPMDQQGDLFFEVVLPPSIHRVASARWELWLTGRRFAEGVISTPQTVNSPGGERLVRIAAPLTWRHLGWREGATFLDVGVRGEVTPWGAPEGLRLPFRARAEVLVTGAPLLEEATVER